MVVDTVVLERTTSEWLSRANAKGESTPCDHAWIERIMQSDGPGILHLLHRMLGNEADTMDAYQDCFCKLAGRGSAEGLASSRAYAYKTAVNIATEVLRTRRRRQSRIPGVAREKSSAERNVVERVGASQNDDLRQAMLELPQHLRQVVVLRDLTGMSYNEVGKTLGIDPATARVYRRHAVVKLAEILGPGGRP